MKKFDILLGLMLVSFFGVSQKATTFNTDGGDWSVPGDWTNGLPGATDTVYVAQDGTVDDDFTIAKLVINAVKVVEVKGGELTVTGDLLLATEAELNVDRGDAATVQGNIDFQNSDGILNIETSNGHLTIGGNLLNAGSADISLGSSSRITYNGASAQTIAATSYGHLVFSGAGEKQIEGNITVGQTFTANTSTVNFTKSSGTQDINSLGSAFYNVILSGGGNKDLKANIDVDNNLTINSGVTVRALTYNLNIGGDLSNSGTYTATNSEKVIFDGANAQQISGSSTTTLMGLELSKTNVSNALTLNSSVHIDGAGSVTFTNGTSTLNANGNLTLLSTSASNGATIGAIPSGSSITNNVIAQRYFNSTSRRWWTISSPIASVPVSDLQGEITVTGNFTGKNTVSGGNNFPSLLTYDETNTNNFDDGWTQFPVTANTENFAKGAGYGIYVRNDNTTTVTPKTLSVTGVPYQGNTTFTLNYTTGGSAGDEGWNLVGNPYASAIDWNSGNWTKTNIQTEAYFWNGSAWSQVSTIAPFQGFFVKATSASAALTATENVKVTSAYNFARTAQAQNVLEVSVVDKSYTGLSDQSRYIQATKVIFDQNAVSQYESDKDASYLPRNIFRSFNETPMVDVATGDATGNRYMKNVMPITSAIQSIPVYITYTASKKYKFELYKQNFTATADMALRDNYTNQIVSLANNAVYDFTTDSNPASTAAGRFEILVSNKPLATDGEISSEIKMDVYPNPSQGKVTLNATNVSDVLGVKIATVDGNEVYSTELNSFDSVLDTELDLTSLKKGVYIISLTSGNVNITEKLIIK